MGIRACHALFPAPLGILRQCLGGSLHIIGGKRVSPRKEWCTWVSRDTCTVQWQQQRDWQEIWVQYWLGSSLFYCSKTTHIIDICKHQTLIFIVLRQEVRVTRNASFWCLRACFCLYSCLLLGPHGSSGDVAEPLGFPSVCYPSIHETHRDLITPKVPPPEYYCF